MQAMFEIVFYVVYLGFIMTLGYFLLINKSGFTIHSLFGAMAVIVALGQGFYIVTKILSLLNAQHDGYIALIGIGRLTDSLTVTLFFLFLYLVYKLQYSVNNQNVVEVIFYILVVIRIILCLLPQNQWTDPNPSSTWAIYRSIPFFIIGILLTALFIKEIKIKKDKDFIFMPIAIFLSFLFYFPVVMWSNNNSLVGFFMVPTLLCYLWIIWMGYTDLKNTVINPEVLI